MIRFVLWIFFLIWLLFVPVGNLLVDWQWFSHVSHLELLSTRIWMQISLWIGTFVVTAGYIYLQTSLANRTERFKLVYIEDQFEIELTENQWRGLLRILHLVVALVSAFTFANLAAGQWLHGLALLDPESFGQVDPVFGHDLGFYVFQLPMIQFVVGLIEFVTIVTLFLTAFQHLGRDVLFGGGEEGFSEQAQRHLLGQGAFVFAIFSIDWFLERYQVLFTQEGAVWGAGYADLNARIPGDWIMVVVSILVAGVLLKQRASNGEGRMSSVIFGYFIARFLVVGMWPSLIQEYMVKPNELKYEGEYLKQNIQSTQQAYALDRIQVKPFESSDNLSMNDIEANPLTVKNIRIWDDRPLLTTYGQLQEIRSYYDFYDVDIDRYMINGELRQIMLSGRELNYNNVSGQAQSWVNEHFQYTHGYGLTLSPVNQVSQEGLPNLFIKDIPPQSSIDLTVDRSEIYYGELTNSYVVVNGDVEEFDYPQGDQNVYTKYAGTGGVPVGGFFQRLLYTWHFGDVEMFLSNYLLPESKLLFRRNISERIQTLAPFLVYDSDPYLVVNDGRLFWMMDAYTTTDNIPYAEPYPRRRFNYIRNSVKVVVDAYNGSVDFYLADESDPIIRFYESCFPNTFQSMDDMPEGLREHVRYPSDFFDVQATMYRAYHMNDVNVFYNKEDMWGLPKELYDGKERRMESYYLIMELPEEQNAEFVLLLPFVPTGKDNMISWLAARSDGDNYGKLVLYQFPKQKLIYGPRQIEARIDQDPEISKQITLWSQSGSRVVRGNLLVIPIASSLMYVEPLYLQAESSQLPELKRVIVSYGNRIAMEKDLSTALLAVFGEALKELETVQTQQQSVELVASSKTDTSEVQSFEGRLNQANLVYQQAIEAQRAGDWAAYGEYIQQLGALLAPLESTQAEPTESIESAE
jgi:uncharacterized membrane protein (UPF0182 family)